MDVEGGSGENMVRENRPDGCVYPTCLSFVSRTKIGARCLPELDIASGAFGEKPRLGSFCWELDDRSSRAIGTLDLTDECAGFSRVHFSVNSGRAGPHSRGLGLAQLAARSPRRAP